LFSKKGVRDFFEYFTPRAKQQRPVHETRASNPWPLEVLL